MTRSRLLAFAILLVALADVSDAQRPTGLILGRVVDNDTGAGVSGVVVTLATIEAGQQQAKRVLTDEQGRFVFRELAKGSYAITTTIGGNGYSPAGFLVTGLGQPFGAYLDGAYGRRRPGGPGQLLELGDGEKLGNVEIRAWKGGAIDGTVFDEANEPLAGVIVSAVRRDPDGRLLTGPTTRTDDRGSYHLHSLQPGDYVVVVPQLQALTPVSTVDAILSAPPDQATTPRFFNAGATVPNTSGGVRMGTSIVTTAPPNLANGLPPIRRSDGTYAYQTTFHPSVPIATAATVLSIRAGELRSGVAVHLRPVKIAEVSGVLNDASGPVPNFGVHLMPEDTGDGASVLELAVTATDGRGAFSFPAVAAGRYRVLALRPSAPPPAVAGQPPPPATRVADQPGVWASQSITVGDTNVGGVTMTLRAGASVTGHVEFRGSLPRPSSNVRVTIIAARPLFRTGALTQTVAVDPSGDFAVRGLPPGRYELRVADVPPWTMQSITSGTHDITEMSFEAGDADITGVMVVMTERLADVTGTVQATSGGVDPSASVYFFPADRARWPDGRLALRTYRTVRTSTTGTFRVPGVQPGEYLAVAVRDELDPLTDWPHASVLAKLAPLATAVRVDQTPPTPITLKTVTLR